MKDFYLILLCFSLFQGSSEIKKIKFFLHQSSSNAAVPDSFKSYLTKEQIKNFEKGFKELNENKGKVFYITYYQLDEKDKLVVLSEGYYYPDVPVGEVKEYYPNGKVSLEFNYILVNDSTNEIIDLVKFSKIKHKEGLAGYENKKHGKWKFYNEDGKLIKEEEYDRGKLIKTTNY